MNCHFEAAVGLHMGLSPWREAEESTSNLAGGMSREEVIGK
ncbi:hypothetical protein ACFLXE_01190 [Chloroflexota bacterium]